MPLTPEQIDALQAEVTEIERTTGYGRVTIAIEGRPKFLETTKSTYLCQENLPDRRQPSPRKPLPG